MRIAFVGAFRPGWATETDMAKALRRQGHQVTTFTESDPNTWQVLIERACQPRPLFELVIWMTAHTAPPDHASAALDAMRHKVPTVAQHLDRWWGLRREAEISRSPFFRCDLVVTADGGHDDEWAHRGIRHRWLPPAIDIDEATIEGVFDAAIACDVVFVGSWRRYHPEWGHRRDLVEHLRRWFGPRFGLWPEHMGPVRGQRLSDLYASTRVVVGDSCLAGGATRYHSDRIPETLGRGGFLAHPAVDGLDEHYKVGEHLVTWEAGDWRGLRDTLDHWLADDDGRARIAAAGRQHVLATATYDNRATELIDICRAENLV